MALLKDFLAGLNFPPVTLLRQYLEDGIPEDLQSLAHCAPTDWCRKLSSKSSELRHRGNQAYRSQKYDEALMYYSQSIAAAPTDSEALALAYGNRAATLQAQMEYELCLLDTNRALDGSLPQYSRTTLLERKSWCWEKLIEQNAMRTKLRANLSKVQRSSQERANLMACAEKLCYISQVDIDDTDLVIDRSLIDDPVFETKFENDMSENVSPKVQRRVDKEWGQIFIATDDIEPGEVLSNDDFHALVVKESNQHEYCSHCSVWCEALIPCVSCSQDMYCSIGCRERAYDTYHETECKLLPLWGNVSATFREARRLFLRMFLTGTKQGSELTTLLNDPRVYAAMNGNLNHSNAQYSSKDYLPILNSPWKFEIDMRDSSDEQEKISAALAIFVGLRSVNFFGDGEVETQYSGNILTGEQLLAAVLLVHNYSLGCSWCYKVGANFWESEASGEPVISKRGEIATAVGPWHTFLNHSCDPNVTRVANRQRMLCRSVRPIKAGEQISVSMGWYYTVHTRKDRQAEFKEEWGRECGCKACVEHWPTMTELQARNNKYLFTGNRGLTKNILNMENWLSTKLNCSIAEEDLKKVLVYSKTIRDHVKEPSYSIVMCELYLRQAMKVRGNFHLSQKYIQSLCK